MAATPPPENLLITLSGRDRPGVTARLFEALSSLKVTVDDLEQVVIRGELVLGVLLSGEVAAARQAVEAVAHDLDLRLEVSPQADLDDPRRRGRVVVTVLGNPLQPRALAALAGTLAESSANIDRIIRLASYPVTSVELEVSGCDSARLRAELARTAAEEGADIAVQPAGLHRRAKRLVCLDVDSTLVQGEVIEMLAAKAGCEAEVAAVTAAAMRGELDFTESLHARVALLKGLPESAIDEVRTEVTLTPGARTLIRTLKRLGYRVAIVSGGFTQVTDRFVAELGIDYSAANTLEVVDGVLTGRVVGAVIDRAGKAEALERFAGAAGLTLAQTVAVGDGANDLDMLGRAGLGVAFNAKPVVREAADTAVNVPYLDTVLYLLGISRDEIEEADANAS